MRSKTLSSKGWFSGALCRSDLIRFWPLWAIYLVGWIIAMPVVQMLLLSGDNGWSERSDIVSSAVRTLMSLSDAGSSTTVSMISGCVLAMAMFAYLTTARSVGFHHSLPIKREGLFLTHYLTGLGVGVACNAVVALLTAAVWAAEGVTEFWAIGTWFLSLTGQEFFFYSVAVLCIMFTGQLLATPVFYVIFNVFAYGIYSLANLLGYHFLYGWHGNSSPGPVVKWLTPSIQLGSQLNLEWERNAAGEIINLRLDGLSVVGAYAAAGVVVALAALAIYRLRRSESAGDIVALNWAKPIFRYGVALCFALSLGQGLYTLLWGLYDTGSCIPALAACMILMGLVGYYTAEMLLKKSFRVFKNSWKNAVAISVVLVALCVCMWADVFGLENRVPAAEEVESVEVNVNLPYSYVNGDIDDPAVIEKILATHQAFVTEKPNERDDAMIETDHARYFYISLRYTLKNGSTMGRSYILAMEPEDMEQMGLAATALAELYQDPGFQSELLDYTTGDIERVYGGSLECFTGVSQDMNGYPTLDREHVQVDADAAQRLLEAYRRDIAAGHVGMAAFSAKPDENIYSNSLELTFMAKVADVDISYTNTNQYSVCFSKYTTYLLDALESEGLKDGLRTHAEIDAALDEYGAEENAETVIGGAGENAGVVIGGADSITGIVVADEKAPVVPETAEP